MGFSHFSEVLFILVLYCALILLKNFKKFLGRKDRKLSRAHCALHSVKIAQNLSRLPIFSWNRFMEKPQKQNPTSAQRNVLFNTDATYKWLIFTMKTRVKGRFAPLTLVHIIWKKYWSRVERKFHTMYRPGHPKWDSGVYLTMCT